MNKRSEKRQNLLAVISTLRQYGAMTQARLKEYCGLQASTISYLSAELREMQLIRNSGLENQNGRVGKPGNIVELNNDLASFLGVYVEDSWIDIYLIGLDGTTLHSQRVPFEDNSVQESIFAVIVQQMQQHEEIHGIGVAIKAIVYNDGSIKSNLMSDSRRKRRNWNFAGLKDHLQEMYPEMPIVVENDANCAVELYRHNREQNQNVLVYLVNQNPFGVGCGMLINGRLFRGASGLAGEVFDRSEHFSKLAALAESDEGFIKKFIPALFPRILDSAYLLDPECIVLTGDCFDHLTEADEDSFAQLAKKSPVPVLIAAGEDKLNPAKGAALLVIDAFIQRIIEEVTSA